MTAFASSPQSRNIRSGTRRPFGKRRCWSARATADPRRFGPSFTSPGAHWSVRADPAGTVTLERISHSPGDGEHFTVIWRLDAESRLSVELDANLSVPRMMPLGGLADSIAAGFLQAAVDALGRLDR